MSINDGKPSELKRGAIGFLLGVALGVLVALLVKRAPDERSSV
ncbi:MAG: hypothetical protein ACYDCC_01265 [Actinomycetota bacterium]